MVKRLHCCTLAIGIGMVLLALVLAVHVQRTITRPTPSQMPAVAQAVTTLQGGCLTCHSAFLDAPALTSQVAFHPTDEPDGLAHTTEFPLVSPQAVIDAQLLDLGTRILALPAVDPNQQAQVVEVFVQTFDDTRTISGGTDSPVVTHTLARIKALDELLRGLENQSNPYHVGAVTSVVFSFDSSTMAAVPSHSLAPVVLGQSSTPSMLHTSDDWATMDDDDHFVMRRGLVYAMHRRGPPAGSFSDSVWSGRLLSFVDTQSPFVPGDHNGLSQRVAVVFYG